MSYQHLTQSQRYQIAKLHRTGLSCREITELLFCHHSTIGRQLQRNRSETGYIAGQAHALAVTPPEGKQPHKDCASYMAAVEARLRTDWSPEQIVGRGIASISIERIYRHIAHDKRCGGSLWRHRRHRKRRYRRIGSPRQRFSGRRLAERPAHAEERKQVGHWEADSVLGKGPVRVIILVERKSRYTRLVRVSDGTAAAARDAILASVCDDRRLRQR